MNPPDSPVITNPWGALRQFTAARIALGRAGVSLPTTAHLAFQLDHARARDAVHHGFDAEKLASTLAQAVAQPHCLTLHSAATNRQSYLQRPDLGRRLDAASRQQLSALPASTAPQATRPYDLAFVVVDGLSALAIEKNAAPFLALMLRHLAANNWSLAPVCLALQGRVAIGDEIGELLGAKSVVVLIGERPGLSSPDSMGLYLSWMPRVGLLDAGRNCISNVRPAGLSLEQAASKLQGLLMQAHQRQLSGVAIKDESDTAPELRQAPAPNFLLP
ncbi:MAG: ethanolamine ammonia-lyase small subunit [Rhodoferax sp.]|jgi:ethanolamine ammonia-lyase small subunit